MIHPPRRWHGQRLLVPLAILAIATCSARLGVPTSPTPLMLTPTAVPTFSPFWQTATARVSAANAPQLTNAIPPTPPLMHALAPIATGEHVLPVTAANIFANPQEQAQTGLSAAPTSPAAPLSGSQLLDKTFFSPTLGREMHYFIYLPAGYAESGRRYPVIYQLHGYGGSNTEWIGYGFPETADHMMTAGEIPPTIIVMPQGDQAYWVNHADGGPRWGDYTAQDVVSFIDATYRTIPDAAHRGIGGLSMGAHGALQLAINYPGVFGVVEMNSPTLRTFPERFDYFGDEAYFNAHDPVHLVRQYPDRARQLRIELDCGAQDTEAYDRVAAFHDKLTTLGIPHTFNTWPGEHNAEYWGPHSRDYLRFYADNLAY